MTHDLGMTLRRAWLHDLARRRHGPSLRHLADRLAGQLVPARRRARALQRATLVRL